MAVRITDTMLTRTAINDITRQRAKLAAVQERASSGLDINRPSDDPTRASAALLLRAGIQATEQFERNVTQARNRVGVVESALADSNDALMRARELAIQGATGTLDASSRVMLAQEVEGIFERLIANGNSRSSESHIFGGFASTTMPFVASGPFVTGSPSPTVAFLGDSNEIQTAIDERLTAPTTLDGRRVFMGDGDGDGLTDAGRENLFEVIGTLRDALMADDPVAVAATLPALDRGIEQISLERTRVGVTDGKLAGAEARLAERKVQLSLNLSKTQDADAAEVFSDLVNLETALRASLDSSSRMLQPSLLDFLA